MSTLPENTTLETGQVSIALPSIALSNPHAKRWGREEYYRLYKAGWFQGQRVQLVDGEILVMSPQSFEHYWSIDAVSELLRNLFGKAYWVRSQAPCPHGEWSEPEPDISVTKGSRDDFTDHPTTAILAVEVSKTSLLFDQGKKSHLYASMGVPDYWVLDLENRQLLVHRKPIADAGVPFGHRYEQRKTLAADSHISPLEKPAAKLAIAQMLPPLKKK